MSVEVYGVRSIEVTFGQATVLSRAHGPSTAVHFQSTYSQTYIGSTRSNDAIVSMRRKVRIEGQSYL